MPSPGDSFCRANGLTFRQDYSQPGETMKLLIPLLCLMISVPTIADSLLGNWVRCEIGKDGYDIEHHLIFGKNNVEFEINVMIETDKKTGKPCQGKSLIMVGTYWHYLEENTQFTSTVFSHYLYLNDANAIPKFNKQKLCGVSSWKINERVDCTDDKYLRTDLGGKRGTKTNHEFILKSDELHVLEDGKTLVYHKYVDEK